MKSILIKNNFGHKKGTRWRGHEVQRIEAFSDAVFAFAVTLLAVSLEVPKSFDELLETMKGFVGFALTFAILFMFWYRQYIYFRKYGIDDKTTIILNGFLIFSVLFFIFPFKFMSYLIVTMFFGFDENSLKEIINIDKMPELLSLYLFGIALMNFVLGLLYRHALRYRLHLQLNEAEEKEALGRYFNGMLTLPAFGTAIALLFIFPPNQLAYALTPVILLVISNRLVKSNRLSLKKFMPGARPFVEEE